MATQQVSKAVTRRSVSQPKSESLIKRFAMVFESLVIVFITAVLMWSTQFFDVTAVVLELSSGQHQWQLGDVVTLIAIAVFGLVVLLTRYSLYLHRKIRQQFVAEEEIKRLAFFDSLTNLPNKELCHNRLEHALARAARNNSSIAVLFISIDDFKTVNDQQGQDGGDKLL